MNYIIQVPTYAGRYMLDTIYYFQSPLKHSLFVELILVICFRH